MRSILAAGAILALVSCSAQVTTVKPGEVQWSPAPGLTPGTMTSLQYGDLERGPYQVLIKFPTGGVVQPHYHKVDEFATVVSGAVVVGQGETIDDAKGVEVSAGGYVLIPAGTAHWAKCKSDAVIARFAPGPRELTPCSPEKPAPNRAGRVRAVQPKDVPWTQAPGMAPGVQTALQYGDPEKGPYIILLKFPAGTVNRPHWHSADEVATVISGTMTTGTGETVDDAQGMEVPAGGYFLIPGKVAHWGKTKGEVVLSRMGNGPRDIFYLDSK